MSTLRIRPRLVAVIACVILVAAAVQTGAARAAVTALTVAQAIALQDGSSGSVVGFVVGEPVSATTVNRSGFAGDTAIAIADVASETSSTTMLFVQVTTAYRSAFGLRSTPALLGKQIEVTGSLSAYFSPHAGLKAPTAMTISGATPTPPPTTTTASPTITPTGPPGGGTDTYYANALGRSGADLKAALHTIIRTQSVLSYDGVWTALEDTDQDPANPDDVIEIYSGRSVPKSSNGGNPDGWNREHVSVKSHGDLGTTPGPGTDVHHLRPEDVSVNGARGNLDFDNGGNAVVQCAGCLADADSFQPRDTVKGDVARMIFYMAVRYSGDDGFADLEVNESVNNGSAPDLGRLSVLKAWSDADPPDAFEQRRNEVIDTTWQHNRNPFIDHPEWVDSILP
jgi:endonuclease I